MKKYICLFAILFLAITTYSQTQQGFVKTKGRMVNGKYVPGHGLNGAVVSVQGRTPVVAEGNDGAFSFPVPSQTYMLQSVQKSGYQLVDVDALKKTYTYSANPHYLVMETPEQQLQDQLDAEKKIRRTLQQKLQQREDELEALRSAQKITLEEYQQALHKLYVDQEDNDQLIADMAKEYSRLDYDQMNELNQRISDAILNGRLIEADSLLRTKGGMKSRYEEIVREKQAEAQREKELAQEMADLAKAKEGTQKKLEDYAEDCYKYFNIFKLNMEWDSAAYYIELRAELDTANGLWQFEAAYYFDEQMDHGKAEKYYWRCFYDYLEQDRDDMVAIVLNCLASLQMFSKDYETSETMYLEVLMILGMYDDDEAPPYLDKLFASVATNLGILYYKKELFENSEAYLLDALQMKRQLLAENPQENEAVLLITLRSLGVLYNEIGRYVESETCFQEALGIYSRLAMVDKDKYEAEYCDVLNGYVYSLYDQGRYSECKGLIVESLDVAYRLAKTMPKRYEPKLAAVLELATSGLINHLEFDECEPMYLKALDVYRSLHDDKPRKYESRMAALLAYMAINYSKAQRFEESEAFYLEAIESYRRLAKENMADDGPGLANTLQLLASLYKQQQRLADCETLYFEALEVYEQLIPNNPRRYSSRKKSVIGTLYGVINSYQQQGDYEACCRVNQRILDLKASDNMNWGGFDHCEINQSYFLILNKEYAQAEQYARRAIDLGNPSSFHYSMLAASLLFQGKYSEARLVYDQHKDEAKEAFLKYLDEFEKAGVVPGKYKDDVARIKTMLSD